MDAFEGRRRREPAATPESPLDGLLADMRELRLTLAADLRAAAGAAEEGFDDVAAQIVDGDRRELALFARDADRRLRRLQRTPRPIADGSPEPARPRWRRRLAIALPVVPMVGALAVSAAAATGVLALPNSGHDQSSSLSAPALPVDESTATSTFREFADVVGGDPSASQVIAAAGRLHHQLVKLLASSSTDPDSAAQLVQLLRMEQSLLLTEQPPGADVVLHATRKLAKQLVDAVNALTQPTAIPTALATVDSTDGDSGTKSTKTSPAPSPTKSTSSPKPTSSTTSPAPEPSSSSSYEPPPLPGFPHSDDS